MRNTTEYFFLKINSYFDFTGWDNVEIQPVADIKAVDVVSGNMTADEHNLEWNKYSSNYSYPQI